MARVLVILLSRLGDMIQATPCLRELRRLDPSGEIHLMVLEEAVCVLTPALADKVWPLPTRYLRALNREVSVASCSHRRSPLADQLLETLHLPWFDRIINLDYGAFAAWLAQHIPAATREGGLLDDDGNRFFLNDWVSHILAEVQASIGNQINLVDFWRGAVGARRTPAADERVEIDAASALPWPLPAGRRLALNPGASEEWRRWPPERFAAVAQALQGAGLTPMLVGAPGDRELCAAVQARCPAPLPNFCGQTDVAQMAALLGRCELLVSNDTGAVHLAAARGTRVLGIYGNIDYFRLTAPWAAGHLLLYMPPPASAAVPAAAPASADAAPASAAVAPRWLPEDLVVEAALERVGLLERDRLHARLDREGIQAWETYFLPPGADPIGGLAYRPLHSHRLSAEELFRLMLRHAFAWEYSNRAGPLSAAHLREEVSAGRVGLAANMSVQAGALAAALLPYIERFENIAQRAAATSAGVNVEERRREGKALARAIAALPAPPPEYAGLKLVIYHLGEQIRYLDGLPPERFFPAAEHHFRRAARLLSLPLQMMAEMLQPGPAV